MAKLTLNTIGSRYGSVDALNDNFDAIEQAFENTYSRDGTGPNTLEASLDANSQRIVNLPTPVSASEPATKGWVEAQPNQAAASAIAAAASAAAAAVSETNAEEAASQVVDWVWKDEWATGVVYKVNNLVSVPSGTYEGWTFICVVEHTAGATFSTDFSAGKWDVIAKRGSAGAGTGDMLAANNLSELTNIAAARTNLGVPSATGSGASGSWGISITGNAATATTVADSAITATKIATGAVTAAKVADDAITKDKLQSPSAGLTYLICKLQDATRSTISTSYADANAHRFFSADNHLGVTVLVPGVIRCSALHATNSGYTAYLRVLKNGTQVTEWTSTVTAYAQRTTDITVDVGDVIVFQQRTAGGIAEAASFWYNLRIYSNNPSMAVA